MTSVPPRYRVLDLTDERGLMAGHLLAQLGADVIQAEPLAGSPGRSAAPLDHLSGASLFWAAYAAGKRSVSLDYSQPSGREILLDLIRQADLLIESAEPGEMAALGLDYASLRAVNPRLVHVSITAFGSTGPKANYADTDLIVWAASGAVWPHRGQDGVPLRISVPQAYLQASIDAVGGALIALMARGEDGPGQHVDISAQASCMLCTLSTHLAMAVNHEDFNALGGQSNKLLDLSGSGARTRKTKWQVRDGLVEMHIGMGPAAGRYANALFVWLDSLGDCPAEYAAWDWVKMPDRLMNGELNADDLNGARAYVATVLEKYSKAEILAIAQERGLLMAPVLTTADLMDSPQLAARNFFQIFGEGDHAVRLPDPFAGCGLNTGRLPAAPYRGEHNVAVLAEWLGIGEEAARIALNQKEVA